MGVDYTPILAIGLEFDCQSDIEEFLLKHKIISEDDEDFDIIESDGITEFMYNHDSGLDCECLNLYSGDYYFLGFRLYVGNPKEFHGDYIKALQHWEMLFPEVPAEMIHTIKVH